MVEEDEIPKGFIEWEGIKYSHHLQSSQSLNKSDPPNPSNRRSMVAIRDSNSDDVDGDRSVVFPPINHEGLHISSSTSVSTQNQQNHQSPPPWSPFDVNGDEAPFPPSNSGRRTSGEVLRLMGLGFELLRSRATRVIGSLQSYAASGWSFWSFRSAAGVALTAMILWLFCLRRRRESHCRVRRESEDQLLLLIKEKDEKINQLLHQIAQMNKVLLALQRVPSTKTS